MTIKNYIKYRIIEFSKGKNTDILHTQQFYLQLADELMEKEIPCDIVHQILDDASMELTDEIVSGMMSKKSNFFQNVINNIKRLFVK